MSNLAETLEERFSYGDYRRWPDDERWELIDGEAWLMASPTEWHQILLGRMHGELYIYLKGKPCRALPAPFDVLIPKDEDPEEEDDKVDTVVQPDIVVYCDRTKLREAFGRGAPELVVEILSKSTETKDRKLKYRRYERAGVREYWIVDPMAVSIEVFPLVAMPGHRRRFGVPRLREEGGDWSRVESSVLEGFSIDPADLFASHD